MVYTSRVTPDWVLSERGDNPLIVDLNKPYISGEQHG